MNALRALTLFCWMLALVHSRMITEPPINTLPDNPFRIYQNDLPLRIEAAIQPDYEYSDWYSFIPDGSQKANYTYIYIYEGCKRSCLPSRRKFHIRINGEKQEYNSFSCLVAKGFPGNLPLNITFIGSPKQDRFMFRYGLHIFTAPPGSEFTYPPHISCTEYFQHYDYFYPPLPYTGRVGDPFFRSTCYEPPYEFQSKHSKIASYLGPYTVPLAVNFEMTNRLWQDITFFIETIGEYDILIRRTAPRQSPCDFGICTHSLRFSLYRGIYDHPEFVATSDRYNRSTPTCDSNWRINLRHKGYHFIAIQDNFDMGGTYTFFISYAKNSSPFSVGNCAASPWDYQGPCRRDYPVLESHIPRSSHNDLGIVLGPTLGFGATSLLITVFLSFDGFGIAQRFPQLLGIRNFLINIKEACCRCRRDRIPVPQDEEEDDTTASTIATTDTQVELELLDEESISTASGVEIQSGQDSSSD